MFSFAESSVIIVFSNVFFFYVIQVNNGPNLSSELHKKLQSATGTSQRVSGKDFDYSVQKHVIVLFCELSL